MNADNNASRFRTPACLLLLAPVPFLCLMAVLFDLAPAVAGVLLGATLLVFGWAARQRFGSPFTLLGAFFLTACAHTIIGYLIAGRTSRLIWIGSHARQAYEQAFLVMAAGSFAAAVGYALALPKQKQKLLAFCHRLELDDSRVLSVARVLVPPGILLILFVYARIGLVPLLADSPGRARYFNYQLSDDYLLYEWLVSRALDLLTFSLPLVLASALWFHRKLDCIIAVAGLAALLMPLRRANVLSVFIVLLLMHLLKVGRAQLKHAAVVLVLVGGYAVSQLIFINLIGIGDFDSETGFAVVGSALPEVRDLGWSLDLMQDHRLYGTTFVQALVPVPSLISDFSQTHSLRAVTSRLIGLDVERQTGGLRLTAAGEGFLNFGYFGPVIVGALFGMACAYVEAAMRALQQRGAMWAYYLASVVFVWLCFWVYLGGTQAAATVKIGAALLLFTLYLSRVRVSHALEVAPA